MGENLGKSRPVASHDSSKVFLEVAGSKGRSYSFDRVFHPSSSQGAQSGHLLSLYAFKLSKPEKTVPFIVRSQ